jgi:hypothetical protein
MAARYQHITEPAGPTSIALRVNGLIWKTVNPTMDDQDEDPDDGTAGVRVPA